MNGGQRQEEADGGGGGGERQGETVSTREMRKGNPCLTFTGRGLARGKAEFPRWEDSLSQGQLGGSQEAGMREGRNEGGQDMGAVISRRCSKLTHARYSRKLFIWS